MATIYWTTQEGTLMLPRAMSDSHITNTIRLVARKHDISLVDADDWEVLAGLYRCMPYIIYEAVSRKLDGFGDSLNDWAYGDYDIGYYEHEGFPDMF